MFSPEGFHKLQGQKGKGVFLKHPRYFIVLFKNISLEGGVKKILKLVYVVFEWTPVQLWERLIQTDEHKEP